jgi:S-adenosylmethionine hydrolase
MKRPIITLLTDFGAVEHYVGAMKGVILGICPEAVLVDISHEVTPYAIPEAAFTLAQAWKCFPPRTVHLVVVDPGVGSSRRAILMEAGGHFFVAPDNGVLTMVMDEEPKHRVREISGHRWFRKPVSQTFHGRDIFAPVAANTASGVAVSKFGRRIGDYVRLDFSKPKETDANRWAGSVLKIDRFGNIVTNFDESFCRLLASRPFRIDVGSGVVSRLLSNYAEAPDGEPFAICGSSGYLEISVKQESAGQVLNAKLVSTVLVKVE